MNSFDDDAMRYEKRSMVNDYLDQMKGKGFNNHANWPKMMKLEGPLFWVFWTIQFGKDDNVSRENRLVWSQGPSSLVLIDYSFWDMAVHFTIHPWSRKSKIAEFLNPSKAAFSMISFTQSNDSKLQICQMQKNQLRICESEAIQ